MNTPKHNLSEDEIISQMAEHYRAIIELCGEDPTREGLVKTPVRAAKAMYFATKGYRESASEVMKQAIFEYAGSKIIVVKDIEFYSLCEHHILPFFGTISIGYIPNGNMIGLSKLARVVNVFARRLQVQERLTAQVCKAVGESLAAHGVIVACKADHLCMKMRGVEKQNSSTVTLEYSGRFAENPGLREEFMRMI